MWLKRSGGTPREAAMRRGREAGLIQVSVSDFTSVEKAMAPDYLELAQNAVLFGFRCGRIECSASEGDHHARGWEGWATTE